jgi:hypothetical protein
LPAHTGAVMERGFFLTLQAIRRQLAAMPADLYLIRLIHSATRKPYPGERIWNRWQVCYPDTVRFLRLRNREGFDVYLQTFAGEQNAGYILLDLDHGDPRIIPRMRADGHAPCVVLQTSPGHLQAWVQVSPEPLEPGVATAISKQLARRYGGDRASTDWRHLGRLAGFTNQKPTHQRGGYAPWVKLLYAQTGLALQGPCLVEAARHPGLPVCPPLQPPLPPGPPSPAPAHSALDLTPAAAIRIYARCLQRLRIPQRFPQPDWSIADLWIAKHLLACRVPAAQVQAVLQLGSPGFPRRHCQPQDYLHRTLARAARELLPATPFSAHPFPPCAS